MAAATATAMAYAKLCPLPRENQIFSVILRLLSRESSGMELRQSLIGRRECMNGCGDGRKLRAVSPSLYFTLWYPIIFLQMVFPWYCARSRKLTFHNAIVYIFISDPFILRICETFSGQLVLFFFFPNSVFWGYICPIKEMTSSLHYLLLCSAKKRVEILGGASLVLQNKV